MALFRNLTVNVGYGLRIKTTDFKTNLLLEDNAGDEALALVAFGQFEPFTYQ